jgi:nucleoside-diphosphate-sugar epimerase
MRPDIEELTRMKVLVTGGAGYIGAILCPMLLDRGYKVVLLDNFMWGIHPVLHFINHPNLTVVHGDVRDRATVRKAVSSVDAVIHLAAIVGFPACAADPNLAQTTNVDGTRLVCDAVSKSQMVMFASTGSTYGQVDSICTEDTPINPLTLYGRTKRDAEKLILDEGGVGLRFATVFGLSPRLRLDLLVNDFCYQAYHNKQVILFEGHHRRTFLHSRDAAEIYPFAIEHYEQMKGQVFNIGSSDMNYTKLEIAKKVQEKQPFYLHEAAVGEDLDKRNYEVSYEKINALGYRATVTLEEGIAEVLRVVPYIKQRSEWRNAA